MQKPALARSSERSKPSLSNLTLLRGLLKRVREYGGIEPQLDHEIDTFIESTP